MKTIQMKKGVGVTALVFGLALAQTASAWEIEAEDMVRSGYSIVSSAVASGGAYVQLSGSAGTVSCTYTGPSGVQDVAVYYFDETDGENPYTLSVNGAPVDSWIANENLGSAGVEAINRTVHEIFDVPLATGDTLSISAVKDGAEYGRIDNLTIQVPKRYRYQAEDMALVGYSIVSNAIAANSHYIQTSSTGTATQVFSGNAGRYNVDTFYFDETDGIGSYELRIDGLLVDSWLADGTFGTAGPSFESLTSHRSFHVLMQSNSVIQLQSTRENGEYGRVDEILFTAQTYIEAEEMVLDNYAVETNSVASNGLLIRLAGNQGSAKTVLTAFSSGTYDLTISYFDETGGTAAFKVYVDGILVDAWLSDRRLGGSEASELNRVERTIQQVYLRTGNTIEISGLKDGTEACRLDWLNIQASPNPGPLSSMDWNADGSIASLVLNGDQHLDTAAGSGVDFRVFNGYSMSTFAQDAADQQDSVVELHDNEFSDERLTFRMDEYDHHVVLRLIGLEGVPRDDPSLNIRLEIPYLSTLGYQLMDPAVTAHTVGGDLLEIDWAYLSSRGLLAGGQIALYATADSTAALAEIEQVHTDNGNLDDYYAWIDGFPITGTNADLSADPDGDGLNNLTEYALGGFPNLGNDGVGPVLDGNGDDLDYLYNRRIDAVARGLTYTVLRTDDLINPDWTTNGLTETGAMVLDAYFENVTNLVDTAGTTNGFIRLDIELEK